MDQFVIGFALFSMFFGAGNIIFPPYLGLGSGPDWILGFICYYIADIGLAILAIFALLKNGGNLNNITDRIGRVPGEVMVALIILCIGPFIALPRTGATTFEMFVAPLFGQVSPLIPMLIFFAVALLLTLNESAVIDIIGKFLTPVLFIGLMVLIIIGIINPVGSISDAPMLDSVATEGINAGYQTMDVLAAMIFGIIIVKSVEDKGYKKEKLKYATARNASLIAGAGLLIIYCGLTYLGATTSELFNMNLNRSELIVNITYGLLGNAGTIVLGVVVTLACLTTAIALITSTADYFHGISNGKLSYKLIAVVTALMSALLAMVGTDMIISIAAPVLSLLYPGAMTLLALSFMKEKISNWTLRFCVVGALFGSLLTVLYDMGAPLAFVPSLPLSGFGLSWILFAVAFGIIGMITGKTRASKAA